MKKKQLRMKVLTCLVIIFTLFYGVQNFSLPGFGDVTRYLTGKGGETRTTKNSTANNQATNQSDSNLVCYPPLGKKVIKNNNYYY